MTLVRNSMGYTSAIPCGDAVDDWCSGAEYSSWRSTANLYVQPLTALAEGTNPSLGVRAGALLARLQIFPEQGGTIWEYPLSALQRPTSLQLAQLVQAMFDLIEEAGLPQPQQVKRNADLPVPSEGLGYLGWGLAIGGVGALLGYFYMRGKF